MKVLPLLFACLFVAGCDGKKMTSLDGPEDNDSASELAGASNSGSESKSATAKATPKPSPKPGEWMLKNYKNPLDPPKR